MRAQFFYLRMLGFMFAVLLSLTGTSDAIPVSALNLQNLTEKSEFVIIGRTGTATQVGSVDIANGPQSLQATVMEIQVDVVSMLKGTGVPASIPVRFPLLQPREGSIGLDGIPSNSIRLLFLKLSSSASYYEVVAPHYPSLPATTSLPTLSSSPVTAVAEVECAVITDSQSNLSEQLKATWALRHVDQSCILPTLRLAAQTSSSRVMQLTAEAELLSRNDISMLDTSIEHITTHDNSLPDYLRQNLLVAIRDGVHDPSAVASLLPLTQDSQEDVRIAVVTALKNIGSPSCIPTLLTSLSDSNQEVRYIAVTALADINKMPQLHPSIPEFRANEGKYTSYWESHKTY